MTIPSGIVGKMMSACHIFSFLASEEGRIVELVVVNHPSLRDNCDVNQFVDVHVDDVSFPIRSHSLIKRGKKKINFK